MMSLHLKKLSMVIAILMSAVLVGTPQALAQELSPEHLVLAREYVDLTDKGQIYERTLIQTGISTMRTIVGQNPDIAQLVSDTIGAVIASYGEEKDSLMDQFATVYALRFTEAELVDIVAFYSSDVGQKLAEENIEANRELEAVMGVFRNNLNTEFYAKVRADLREADVEI